MNTDTLDAAVIAADKAYEEARTAELKKLIFVNKSARAHYHRKGAGQNAILIAQCTGRIEVAEDELRTLEMLAALEES